MSKTVISVMSDPKSGSEEALGRLLNALVLGNELKERGEPFEIIFQGTGTRWPHALENAEHPAHGLYNALRAEIKGVCSACAQIFEAEETTLPMIKERPLPGTEGVTDLAQYIVNGDRFLSF